MVAATIPDIDPRMVYYIISHGADINYAVTSGKTALIIAAENGNLSTVKQLLAANATYDHTSLITTLTEKITQISDHLMQAKLLGVKTYLEDIEKTKGGKPTKKQHKKCSKKKERKKLT
jgi:ankyrin repeat protein